MNHPHAHLLDGLRVLVLESRGDERETIRLLLCERGAAVEALATAVDGFEALERWHPDVLVSDIALADEDGYAMITRVRALEPDRGGGVPAAALSDHDAPETRARALAAGFQAQIARPVTSDVLVALVAMLAGRFAAIDVILGELRTRSERQQIVARRIHALAAERDRLLADPSRLRTEAPKSGAHEP